MGRQKWLGDKIPLLNCDAENHGLVAADEAPADQVESPTSEKEFETTNQKGIGWLVAAYFIIADIAGGGVVTLPKAIMNAGGYFNGLIVTTVVCSIFCYTGILLGENWLIMMKRWPMYRKHCRHPYPSMAFRSIGKNARIITSATLNVMLYGVSVVYLLLSSKIINDMVGLFFNLHFGECKMLVLLAFVLWPLVMCKSPQDFWWAILAAMSTTLCAVILILIGIIRDSPECKPAANFPKFEFGQLVTSLGIFMFGFGGHGVFPSICQDMKTPKQFKSSVILAFIIVCLLYVPVALLAYSTYGDALSDSVLNSIQTQRIQELANLFIALHCILTLSIVINPLSNELEHYLNAPHEFGLHRIIIRSGLLCTIIFVALTVPSFGPILNLLGGTTVALTSGVYPCLFNLFLRANENVSRHETKSLKSTIQMVIHKTSFLRLFINLTIIVLTIICGIITSRAALIELSNSSFSVPCYFPSYKPALPSHTLCCGKFKNISSLNEDVNFCTTTH